MGISYLGNSTYGKIFCHCYFECFELLKITVFVLYSLISTKIYDNGKLVTSLDFFS